MKSRLFVILSMIVSITWGQQFPKYLYGVASWYGEEFAGKKTASGATYDPEQYTAAHRTLPFGTLIEVENLENGKKVQVTVNDRGPFVDDRILDVSKKAAEDLGFVQKGTAYVKVTIIRLGDEQPTNTSLPTNTTNSSYPQPTSMLIITNYVTNQVLTTNYTNLAVEKAIVVPYEEKPVTTPIANPSFILDEPEEIFVPALRQKTSNISSGPSSLKTQTNTPSEPQIIFSDILLPEERVIPLETKPVVAKTNEVSPSFKEELRVSPQEKLKPGERYVIQVGAFTRQDNAIKLYQKLRDMGLPAFTSEVEVHMTRYIRVRVGYYNSREEAQRVLNRLYAENLNPLLIKVSQ
ncbi:septal ring lytic transglycosylase RlpA family protein [Thermospira aquatica]|uniref:Probable endolytic peptidoglycan transglycosylase RlpA n=1 Tax=Thermospira aquatica TaxID=2828656 RepID=A0AAX3BC50_9SPIR|nr:septal ring lytic transglycosylase RlpA family protein [Thermospira aquatica]URA09830.1 septal ring lytic transglycosylase RlpA family protein [Thermospira aquatica]